MHHPPESRACHASNFQAEVLCLAGLRSLGNPRGHDRQTSTISRFSRSRRRTHVEPCTHVGDFFRRWRRTYLERPFTRDRIRSLSQTRSVKAVFRIASGELRDPARYLFQPGVEIHLSEPGSRRPLPEGRRVSLQHDSRRSWNRTPSLCSAGNVFQPDRNSGGSGRAALVAKPASDVPMSNLKSRSAAGTGKNELRKAADVQIITSTL